MTGRAVNAQVAAPDEPEPDVTELAAQHQVSRKFVYQQLHQAHNALDQAFHPPPDEPDQLLWWLPVTKP